MGSGPGYLPPDSDEEEEAEAGGNGRAPPGDGTTAAESAEPVCEEVAEPDVVEREGAKSLDEGGGAECAPSAGAAQVNEQDAEAARAAKAAKKRAGRRRFLDEDADDGGQGEK